MQFYHVRESGMLFQDFVAVGEIFGAFNDIKVDHGMPLRKNRRNRLTKFNAVHLLHQVHADFSIRKMAGALVARRKDFDDVAALHKQQRRLPRIRSDSANSRIGGIFVADNAYPH
jgi:hypothetical protein